jgi:ferredoxin-fold anticodon binding domain-containing protein
MSAEELNKLLLARNNRKRTAWHMAAERGKVEILDKLWEWAKEVLKRDDMNNNLLLAEDYDKEIILHHASFSDIIQTLEIMWQLAKEQLTPE